MIELDLFLNVVLVTLNVVRVLPISNAAVVAPAEFDSTPVMSYKSILKIESKVEDNDHPL